MGQLEVAELACYLPTIEDLSELKQQLADWHQQHPQLGLYVLIAEADREQVPQLQALANEMSLPLSGAVFPELIWLNEFKPHGVIVSALAPAPKSCIVSALAEMSGADEVAAEIVAFVSESEQDGQLFLVFDAMTPNIASILDAVYLELGDGIGYMGTNAGSESFQPIPCVFDNQQYVQDAVLLMQLPAQMGISLEHGYSAPDEMIVATSTEGNRIVSIDWRPAFDVYSDLAKRHYGIDINRENFYQYAVHMPFGIVRIDGEVLVRIPVALQEDGSLFCVGEVPENAILTLLNAVPRNSRETVDKLVECSPGDAGEGLKMIYYCAGRRMHLEATAKDELALLAQAMAPAKLFGALSLGEIGSSMKTGYPLFHNATITCNAWGS